MHRGLSLEEAARQKGAHGWVKVCVWDSTASCLPTQPPTSAWSRGGPGGAEASRPRGEGERKARWPDSHCVQGGVHRPAYHPTPRLGLRLVGRDKDREGEGSLRSQI